MFDLIYNLATDKYKGFIPGFFKFLLLILSFIYSLAVRILIFFYHLKPYRLNCKVISVGNITLGGTGKTSAVEYIARYLKQQGHKVAILSRGYMKNPKSLPGRQAGKIQNPKLGYETMGDEPYMLSQRLGDIPIIVDSDRIRAAKKAIKDYSVDTVILDDGFQQWRIKKDLEIVAVDAGNPLGNRHILPRGILREPLSSLKRADIFVLTKANLNPKTQEIKDLLAKINPKAGIFEAAHKAVDFYSMYNPAEVLGIETLRGKTVNLFSGIGDPNSFENLVKSLEIKVGSHLRFTDHHYYSPEDLGRIAKDCRDRNIDTLITTEKDAVRLYDLQPPASSLRLVVLRIELVITQNEQEFFNGLLRLYPA